MRPEQPAGAMLAHREQPAPHCVGLGAAAHQPRRGDPSLTESPFSPLGPGAPMGPVAPMSPWGVETRDEGHTGAPTGAPAWAAHYLPHRGSPGAADPVDISCTPRPHRPPLRSTGLNSLPTSSRQEMGISWESWGEFVPLVPGNGLTAVRGQSPRKRGRSRPRWDPGAAAHCEGIGPAWPRPCLASAPSAAQACCHQHTGVREQQAALQAARGQAGPLTELSAGWACAHEGPGPSRLPTKRRRVGEGESRVFKGRIGSPRTL